MPLPTASSRASTPTCTPSSATCHSSFALAWVPSTALACTNWRAVCDSGARRARSIARTEGGNSSRCDHSCATASAISRVGSSRKTPSAPSRGTSHCRSRNSLSVSSRYNGCPPVWANRKSPSPTSGFSTSDEGAATAREGTAMPGSRAPTTASSSWSVSLRPSGCKLTWLTGRSRPRSAIWVKSCGFSSSPSPRTVPSSSTRLLCPFQ